MIYKEGIGFEYDIDHDAVSEAQQNLTDLLEDWEQYKKKLALEEQVQSLKDAKDDNARLLNEAIKNLENARDKAIENFETLIKAQEETRDASAAIIEENIANLESMKERAAENINSQMEKLQDLSDKWSDSLDISEDSEFYKSLLDIILGDEKSSYTSRLIELQSFVDDWNRQVSRMKTPKSDSSSSSSSSNMTYGSNGQYYSSAKKSYSAGGIIDYTGEADVHGSKPKPEIVLNSNGIENVGSALGISGSTRQVAEQLNKANSGQLDTIKLLSDFVNTSNPISTLNLDFNPTATTAKINSISSQLGMRSVPNLSGYERVGNNTPVSPVNYNIQNINLPEVKNADEFPKALANRLGNESLQDNYRRR